MKEADPLVSVVVIAYDSARYIENTLDSIKAQRYGNLELIVSDDGSSDQTVEICRRWSEQNAGRFVRAEIVESPVNTGIPANCNRGLRQARGEWVKFIAGDDALLENCIRDNADYCASHPDTAVLFSETRKMDEQGNMLGDGIQAYSSEKKGWRQRFFLLPREEQLKTYARKPLFLETSTSFYNRDILVGKGGFDERLCIFEDIPSYLTLLSAGWRLSHMPAYTVVYRVSPDSISKRKEGGLDRKRLEEMAFIYKTYRRPHLSWGCVKDHPALLEGWLDYIYTLRYHMPGAWIIKKLMHF